MGHPRRPDKIACGGAKGVIFAGTATNREGSPIGGAPGHVARTLFSLLFLQTSKRLGTRLLGSLLGLPPPPSPSSCCPPPSLPGQLPALFPSTLTAWTRRTELYPGYARCTFARADTTYRVISLFWPNLISSQLSAASAARPTPPLFRPWSLSQ